MKNQAKTPAVGMVVLRCIISATLALGPVANTAYANETPPSGHTRGVMIIKPTESAEQSPVKIAPPPLAKSCSRPFARPDILLAPNVEAASFDKALDRELDRRRKAVVVDLRQPAAIGGDLPSQLQPWLTEAKSTGGVVSVDQYCQTTRGLFSFLRKLVTKEPKKVYAAASLYDVVFHVDGRSQVVTQVEFRPRAKP